ncbi:hypothetical protein EDD16DRAFT_785346 [Pisolithus croceorrhizus]|nr:hypothetical protein EDD16DRAFT_785346 [Pisolithus croceorrhizus]KAI6123607.1 hypothetical protein EV401DRAFT_1273579 [Pisolithus croceorrhizus]KAI6168048.1 hypothetical protein EDD17DRAFT_742244 [Pisolithus thermaeus]
MDSQYLLPSAPPPSPSLSYNESQSPAFIHSESSSDVEDVSSTSLVSPEENSYPSFARPASHFYHDSYLRCRRISSEPLPTRDLILPSLAPGHHRSHSTPSTSRSCIATQAMLQPNERRRKHKTRFRCEECHQTFTAQFSLKRHQQSHSGERGFKCSIPGCGQSFLNNIDCKRHEKNKKCHPNFLQSTNLESHLRTTHTAPSIAQQQMSLHFSSPEKGKAKSTLVPDIGLSPSRVQQHDEFGFTWDNDESEAFRTFDDDPDRRANSVARADAGAHATLPAKSDPATEDNLKGASMSPSNRENMNFIPSWGV